MTHLIAPPEIPPVAAGLGGNDNRRRMDMRLWQIWLSLFTVLLTTWCCTLGPVPAVLALVTSKHILVAILAMGLSVDAPCENRQPR